MGKEPEITGKKAILTMVLAYAALIVSQLAAVLIGEMIGKFGVPDAVNSAVSGILYVVFVYFCVSLLCKKALKVSIEFCRITVFSVKTVWVIVALILPVIISIIYLQMPGTMVNTRMDAGEICYTIVYAVVFYGIAAGISEELVFRGVIMKVLEQAWNKSVAVIIPSVIFALSHIFGAELDFMSIVQLLVAGSVVGIMFSLIVYESGRIWNSAIVHVIWNIVIVGDILRIGVSPSEYAMFNYVLKSKSFMITGGDFGIEASVIAIAGYIIVSVIAVLLMKKRRKAIEQIDDQT